MTKEEANKIIAEFMGTCYDGCPQQGGFCHHDHKNYLSLDALVPVWEKLRTNHKINFKINTFDYIKGSGVLIDFWKISFGISSDEFSLDKTTIQEAAAIATAKAIQEIDS